MNIPRAARGGAAGAVTASTGEERAGRAAPSGAWRTQDRISRCRGLGYCVIEVHEFDPERPQARPAVGYRVYREAHGFPVGDAIGSFTTQAAAQRRAEYLGARSPEGEG